MPVQKTHLYRLQIKRKHSYYIQLIFDNSVSRELFKKQQKSIMLNASHGHMMYKTYVEELRVVPDETRVPDVEVPLPAHHHRLHKVTLALVTAESYGNGYTYISSGTCFFEDLTEFCKPSTIVVAVDVLHILKPRWDGTNTISAKNATK